MDNRGEILKSLKAIEANQQQQLDGLRESLPLHLTWLILRCESCCAFSASSSKWRARP
jgi:hypothetical protein